MIYYLNDITIIANGKDNCIDLIALSATFRDSEAFRKNNILLQIEANHEHQKENGKSQMFEQYDQLINTQIPKGFNVHLTNEMVKKGRKSMVHLDILTITPITNLWKCPICYHPHSREAKECSMCGYSTESTTENVSRSLKMYQNAWFVMIMIRSI